MKDSISNKQNLTLARTSHTPTQIELIGGTNCQGQLV